MPNYNDKIRTPRNIMPNTEHIVTAADSLLTKAPNIILNTQQLSSDLNHCAGAKFITCIDPALYFTPLGRNAPNCIKECNPLQISLVHQL